jgi:hypothetical protein
MPRNKHATTSISQSSDEPDRTEHFTHNATFGHMTAEEFQAAKNHQVMDLLRWTAHLAAAESEFYRA